MTLRARLGWGLSAIALVLIVPLLFSLKSLEQLYETSRLLRDREFAASMVLGSFRERTDDARRAEDALLFIHDQKSATTDAERDRRAGCAHRFAGAVPARPVGDPDPCIARHSEGRLSRRVRAGLGRQEHGGRDDIAAADAARNRIGRQRPGGQRAPRCAIAPANALRTRPTRPCRPSASWRGPCPSRFCWRFSSESGC